MALQADRHLLGFAQSDGSLGPTTDFDLASMSERDGLRSGSRQYQKNEDGQSHSGRAFGRLDGHAKRPSRMKRDLR